VPLRSLALFASSIMIAFAEDRKPIHGTGRLCPNSDSAIKIAVAVWDPIYGAAQIMREKPYHATLRDGIWMSQVHFQNRRPAA